RFRDAREVTFLPQRLVRIWTWIHRSLLRLQWLPGIHVHAHNTVLSGRALLARASEAVKPFANLNRFETSRLQHIDELCPRQSTADSTRPEIDVPPRRFLEIDTEDDVAVEELATCPKDPKDLSECRDLVRGEIDDAVRHHGIDRSGFDRQRQCITDANVEL